MNRKIRTESPAARPLIFGEVLFDAFPDGSEVLGGAPFNVAWHLHGLGMDPLFVSRVGGDARGERVRAAMRDWGMDLSGLQRDEARPTGTVRVALQQGQPAFDILPDQAYDRIDAGDALRAAGGGPVGLVYHGTLALRDAASRAALHALRTELCAPVCVDLNLRAPWWDADIVDQALRGASWAKLNDKELRMVCGVQDDAGRTPRAQAQGLRARYGIGVLPVTLGERGAFIVSAEGCIEGAAPRVGRVVDTVGAGDAFAAVALAGLTRAWNPAQTLARALEFAAWICGVRGATTPDRGRYAAYRTAWGLEAGVES